MKQEERRNNDSPLKKSDSIPKANHKMFGGTLNFDKIDLNRNDKAQIMTMAQK